MAATGPASSSASRPPCIRPRRPAEHLDATSPAWSPRQPRSGAQADSALMGPQLAAYACVALGSALGGVARYWMGLAVTHRLGDGFPWGTLFINILGSFVIAFFGTLTIADGPRPASVEARLFGMVRLCGGV